MCIRDRGKITQQFFWPNIYLDVTKHCYSCDICQRTCPKGSVKKIPPCPMPIIEEPFQRVIIDLIGPISPPSSEGHQYVLSFVDAAMRYPEAVSYTHLRAH